MAKQTLYHPQSDSQYDSLPRWLVGVDIGGTKVDTLLVDSDFTPHGAFTFPTLLTSPQATLAGIRTAIEETLRTAKIVRSDVAAIGLGVPGQVDPQRGVVDLAVNLGVNPKYSDQMVRGAVSMPHGLGKTVRVVAFCKGENEEKALSA